MPAQPVSILATAQATANLPSLVAAVQFASDNNDLANLLGSAGTLTVFAPTNAAFDALARELTGTTTATAPSLFVPANKALLRSVLTYHVVAARVLKADISLNTPITTVQGKTFVIQATTAGVAITDGRNRVPNIVATDVLNSNGVIHVIDKVILPSL